MCLNIRCDGYCEFFLKLNRAWSKVAAAVAAASSNSESVGFDIFFHKKNSESVGNRL